MSFGDAVLVLASAVLTLAWLESQFGLRISRVWCRVYDSLADVMRSTPPHLRGRKPAECGWGTPSETQLQEVVRVERFANRLPSVREQAGLARAREFQRRYWESQAHRPTPAENARRYAAEGGTW